MNWFKPNGWVYMALVVFIAMCGGFIAEVGRPLLRVTFARLLPVLTFPMGALGAVCAMLLIYSGIATIAEASIVAVPFYAVAGMIQWHVVFPKSFGIPANSSFRNPASKSER
jgi:hypothetical protein